MWQTIIVIILVVLAALYFARRLRGQAKGQGCGCDDSCSGCPEASGCSEPRPGSRRPSPGGMGIADKPEGEIRADRKGGDA
jgi:hypothetical protein